MITWRVIPTADLEPEVLGSLVSGAMEQGWAGELLPDESIALVRKFPSQVAGMTAVKNLPVGKASVLHLPSELRRGEQMTLVGSFDAATAIGGLIAAGGELIPPSGAQPESTGKVPGTDPKGVGRPTDEAKKKSPARGHPDGKQLEPKPAAISFEPAKLQSQFWAALEEEQKVALAERYFQQALSGQIKDADIAAWTAAPEMRLLYDVQDSEMRDALRAQIIRSKIGVHWNEPSFDAVALAAAGKRNELAEITIATSKELLAQMKRWRTLSQMVPMLLVASIIFSVLFTLYAFNLVRDGKLDGPGLALVIFVLALFAISPAVLLLLERPLKGLDTYSPGTAAAPDPAPAASASPSSTAKTPKA